MHLQLVLGVQVFSCPESLPVPENEVAIELLTFPLHLVSGCQELVQHLFPANVDVVIHFCYPVHPDKYWLPTVIQWLERR